ncbi:hypothetical protein HPB49_020994 [Dermacentor silvarum]|uniref:Uncharacterized protein n=1 Tax=Dermacentor silvarum TaxID=543639 RepID=A0ACB8E3D9_DERSI|nr:hypothetical protein HPB49_020994 [Dermacentor silvarum]
MSGFTAVLKSLSEHCNFAAELENMIRDRIVCGVNNADIQTRLLENAELTLQDAVQTALAMKAAKKDAGEIAQANPNGTFSTHRVSSGSVAVTCYRCGGGHLASECKHVKTVCSYCHRRGHLAKVCNTKRKDGQARSSSPHKQRSSTARSSQSSSNRFRVHTVKDAATASPSEVYDIWQINYAEPPPPLTVTVDVCGKPLRMEVDAGASVSVIAMSRLLQFLPSVNVQPSQVFLRSYSGELKKFKARLMSL